MLEDEANSGLDIRFSQSMPCGEVGFGAVYDEEFEALEMKQPGFLSEEGSQGRSPEKVAMGSHALSCLRDVARTGVELDLNCEVADEGPVGG